MEIKEIYNIFLNCNGVCTDTRTIQENCMFFALKGENFNGNKFAQSALEKGASYAIVDEKEFANQENTLLVNNVLETLQKLANYHRKQFDIPFIGITGSNGKTTSKELINSVLSQEFETHFTQGNYNNHIGVPLTLLSITKKCEIAIIEMGANHIGEIKTLCEIAEPNYGVITNIGTAHIEGFGSREGVKIGKSEMYDFVSKNGDLVFTNNDDEVLKEISEKLDKYTYGNCNANCTAELLTIKPNIKLKWKNNEINSTLYGEYNFYNILLAICIGQYFKLSEEKIIKGIETYVSSNNRSQLIKIKNYKIYLDAYNANPSSMQAAIKSFASNNDKNKLMILGDMLELGSISNEEHQNIVDLANKLNINAIFIGKEFLSVKNKFDFKFYNNTDELIKQLKIDTKNEMSILIKGSRGIRLEKIAEYIQE